jgi:hypothetical protein
MLKSLEARLLRAFSKALHDLSAEFGRLAEEAATVSAQPIAQATTPAPVNSQRKLPLSVSGGDPLSSCQNRRTPGSR